jgi:hypothetical protein
MIKIGQSIQPEFGKEVEVRLGLLNQGVNVARILEKQGVDVVVFRGGISAYKKRRYNNAYSRNTNSRPGFFANLYLRRLKPKW